MPSFDTPQPVTVIVEMFLGHVTVTASDRGDTVVEVVPTRADRKDDVRAARETEVGFAGGTLTVRAPAWWKRVSTLFGANPSVGVTIDVPAGSRLHAAAHACRFLVTGELGQCELKSHVGDLHVDRAGPLELQTSGGSITVGQALGRASVTTGTGTVRIAGVEGSAVVKNSAGDSTIGDVTGDLKVNAASGTVTVERCRGSVTARTAIGSIRVGEASGGTLRLETSVGEVEVGIRPGSAAYLDLRTSSGAIRNLMDVTGQPEPGEDTVHVYARSSLGDITVRHAAAPSYGKELMG